MNFEDLKNDNEIQAKLTTFHNNIESISEMLETVLSANVREKLSLKEKVDYDLFIVYTLNTLYWMYLRAKGIDPNTNEVKGELQRIRQYMLKAKEAHERITMRPRLNQNVANRFVKHGIGRTKDKTDEPPAKKSK